MCGLAWRWVSSRSVKNASRVGASGSWPFPEGGCQAFRGQAISSGAAQRYQYVEDGSTWPR